jgi:hypothetical protein
MAFSRSLETVGHMGMGMVVQHDDAINELATMFVLDLSTHLLKH